jgi:hypothetical protein
MNKCLSIVLFVSFCSISQIETSGGGYTERNDNAKDHRDRTNDHCRDPKGCSTTGDKALDSYRNEARNGGPGNDRCGGVSDRAFGCK